MHLRSCLESSWSCGCGRAEAAKGLGVSRDRESWWHEGAKEG